MDVRVATVDVAILALELDSHPPTTFKITMILTQSANSATKLVTLS